MKKYFAFISYSSQDIAWGKKLQRKLEGYRLPSTLCSEHGWERKPLKPVFFAPTDIQPGGLTAELQERLKASKHLIVICSPNSAKSEWVGREIAFFHSLGRTGNIHFFIVSGIPHSGNPDTECFNPIVDSLGLPELLGANINEKVFRQRWLNRERAYVQLITKLLGIEFDSIWQRHRRMLRQKIAAWSVGTIAIIACLLGVGSYNRTVDIALALNETSVHNDNLPPLKDAVVTMILDNETKVDTIRNLDSQGLFANIPHRFVGKKTKISVTSKDWNGVDTTVVLTKNVIINISRDPHIYGDVFFRLYSTEKEQGISNTKVSIAGLKARSDADGFVRMYIPLENQQSLYRVTCEKALENDILTMPTTESTAMIVK